MVPVTGISLTGERAALPLPPLPAVIVGRIEEEEVLPNEVDKLYRPDLLETIGLFPLRHWSNNYTFCLPHKNI